MAEIQVSIQNFVNPELPAGAHVAALDEAIKSVRQGHISIPQIVGSLADELTTEDNGARARACELLAKVVSGVPDKALEDTTLHSLSGFFASRLADFPSLGGALTGALALLKRLPQVGALRSENIIELSKAVLNEVHVQSLTAVDRMLSYEVLETIIKLHPAIVRSLGGEFLEGLIAAIDGEKDPRCLLLAFHLVEIVPSPFESQQGPLNDAAEELFEVIAVYFPISFNPPPNDTRGITREDLALSLERAFAATPHFAPYSIPLFLEKLSSSLTTAKLDSLRALRSCAKSYGGKALSSQTGPLWSALKAELLPLSLEASSIGDVGPVHERSAAVQEAAAEALTQCVRTLEDPVVSRPPVSNPLVNLVLRDPSLSDLVAAAENERGILTEDVLARARELLEKAEKPSTSTGPGDAYEALGETAGEKAAGQERKKEAVEAWRRVLAAVATAGSSSCSHVTGALLERVSGFAIIGYTWLRLLSELACAARTLAFEALGAAGMRERPDPLGGKAEDIRRIFSGVVKAWQNRGGGPIEEIEPLAGLAVTGLEALALSTSLTSPGNSRHATEGCITTLLDVLFHSPVDERPPTGLKRRALDALASISRGVTAGKLSNDSWQGAKEVWAAVTEALLPSLTPNEFNLSVLGTLAESSGHINRGVLTVLRGLVGRLWAAGHGPGGKEEDRPVEVLRLLGREVLPRFGPSPSEQEGVLLFIRSLLEVVRTWPQDRRPSDGLLPALLGALSVATRVCTEANQAAVFHQSKGTFFEALAGGVVWRAGPVLAVLIGLRPNVLEPGRFLQGLLSLALQGSDALIAEAASVALASLLNKWSARSSPPANPAPTQFYARASSGPLEAVSTSEGTLQSSRLDTGLDESGPAPPASNTSPPLPTTPQTPASTQALPPVNTPATDNQSEYSPAIFFAQSPQSVLFESTPSSVLQQGTLSPAGGSPEPSSEPPGTSSSAERAALQSGRRRVTQRLNLSSQGAQSTAASIPPEEVQQGTSSEGENVDSLDRALRFVLDERLFPVLASGREEPYQSQIRGVKVLAMVGQALSMRGHERSKDVIERFVQLLLCLGRQLAEAQSGATEFSNKPEAAGKKTGGNLPGVSSSLLASFDQVSQPSNLESQPSTSNGNGRGADAPQHRELQTEEVRQLADVAAESFGVMTGQTRFLSSGLSEELILSKETHAQSKPLYRQRLFTLSLGPLSNAIRRARNPEERLPLYRGLAHLLKGTPSAALALEAQKVLPLLLESLSALATSRASSDAPLVLSDLLTLTSFMTGSGPARELVGEHVHSVARTLVQLSAFRESASVREMALQALIAAADLPFTRVYPLRNEVHKAVLAALDDPKRAVRKEAVRCRRVWADLSSSK